MSRLRRYAAILAPLSLLIACTQPGTTSGQNGSTATTSAPKTPRLEVTTAADDLEHPWDIAFLPGGDLIFTERDRERVSILGKDGKRHTVLESPNGMWHGGETGLMGIALAPDYAKSGDFITCHGYRSGKTADVRVVRWHLAKDMDSASKVTDLVTGLPSSSGRHGGCSLAVGPDSNLFVGTGDAAIGTNPQDLNSGGGKILRIDPKNGDGLKSNPFGEAGNDMKRRIWTYGHRNVQGLAFDKDGQLWSVEHGPDVDDEVNKVIKGGNYGWNPVPGYNESVPMTDDDLPGKQQAAAWESGKPTWATSGADFLAGKQWGSVEGELAVSALKGESLHFMRLGTDDKVDEVDQVGEFDRSYGRLRAVAVSPDGDLFVSTSNGSDDKIVKASPL